VKETGRAKKGYRYYKVKTNNETEGKRGKVKTDMAMKEEYWLPVRVGGGGILGLKDRSKLC
jgi:hypothetical protein